MAERDILIHVLDRLSRLATSLKKEQLWPLFEKRRDDLSLDPLQPGEGQETPFLRSANDRANMLKISVRSSLGRARDEINKFEDGVKWIIEDALKFAEEDWLGHERVKKWLWNLKAFTYDADDVLDELASRASRLRWKDDDEEDDGDQGLASRASRLRWKDDDEEDDGDKEDDDEEEDDDDDDDEDEDEEEEEEEEEDDEEEEEDASAKERYAPKAKRSCFLNWHVPEVLFIRVAEQMEDVNATLESVRVEYRSLDSVLVVSEGGSSADSRCFKRVRREEIDCEPEEGKWRKAYHELPPHLKQCLGYCCLFPKHWPYEKTDLVNMWIAQGYVLGRENQMLLEDIGGEYFDDLVGRSFFKENNRGSYRMEAVVHDVVTSVWAEECLRIESDDEFAEPKNLRHLSVCSETWPGATALTELINFKKLRTLLFLSSEFAYSYYLLPPNFFVGFECVRVLVLANHGQGMLPPFGFGKMMIHLRYLDASRTGMKTLPETLCDLYNLQTLILPGYMDYQAPERFCKLVNLRHMDPTFESGIAGIGKLTALQNLDTFVVRKKFGYTIKELKDLSQLRGKLSIYQLSRVKDAEEARYACLHNKALLERLELSWRGKFFIYGHQRTHDDFDVLDSLKPHPNLKELTIVYYGGSKHPSWMEADYLSNITSITLAGCDMLERLPPLGCLPSLKSLLFERLSRVERVDREFYGSEKNGQHSIFPSLEVLSFESLDNWVEWEGAENEGQLWFPSLKNLKIAYCEELDMLPRLPSSLRELSLHELELIALPDIWGCYATNHRSFSFLSSVEISSCRQLASLEELLLQHPMPSLSKFVLKDVSLIKSLELKGVVSLEELDISYCPELAVISVGTLASLKILKVSGCTKQFPHVIELISRGTEPLPLLQDVQGQTESDHCSFPNLVSVVIEDCPVLTSLAESFLRHPMPSLNSLELNDLSGIEIISEEELCFLTSLRELSILSLTTLKSIGLKDLVSLQKLKINTCPELVAISFDRFTLPEILTIRRCGNLKQLPRVADMGFLNVPFQTRTESDHCSAFPSPGYVVIEDCPELASLRDSFLQQPTPCIFHRLELINLTKIKIISVADLGSLTSLRKLVVDSLPTLKSLELNGLISLDSLKINYCQELAYISFVGLTSLKELRISGCEVLAVSQDRIALKRLTVTRCPVWKVMDPSELTELSLAFVDLRWWPEDSGWWRWWQNLASLQILSLDNIQNLPSNSLKLQGFSSLEDLTVRSCKDLQSLEGIELLPSLKKLFIQNCPTLEMRYGKGGPDRHKIKHIPQKPIWL